MRTPDSLPDVDDVERLRRRVRATSDPAAAAALGLLLWRRHGEERADEAVEAFALAMVMDVGDTPGPLRPRVAHAAAEYAVALLERALVTSDPTVADLAAHLWNRIANVLPHHAGYLSRLGIALRVQFERTGDRGHLDLAVRAGEMALLRADEDDPDFPSYLCNVAVTLSTVYVHTGDRSELTRAVELLQEAVATLPADHPERAVYLSQLATCLRLRRTDRTDLTTAVQVARQAVAIGTPDDAALLSNLAITLLTSHREGGRAAELDEAIVVAGRAVAAMPADHPNRPIALSNQAAALRSRFEITGSPADLSGAIHAAGSALRTAPSVHPDRAMFQVNVGVALLTRYSRTGHAKDLDNAVRLLRDAEAATPATHADRAARLSHLGLALESQARHTGRRAQLDEAVRYLRAATETGPEEQLRTMFLSNVSNVLLTRFDWVGRTSDVDEAITALRGAVAGTPSPHPDQPMYLGNLAAALLTRFRYNDDPPDLAEAVDAGRHALALTPTDHPARPTRMLNLGTALQTRGREGDLDEAVQLCSAAVDSRTADDPDYPAMLSNLASTLLGRHGRSGDAADLAHADRLLQLAVMLTPPNRPAYGIYQTNRGYVLTEAGRRMEAIELCLAAADATATPPAVRLRAAWHAAELSAGTDPARAAAAARLAIELLPRAASRALSRADQEGVLRRLPGLACDAAALALAWSTAAEDDAVEALETGRVVLFSQIRDEHPDLARLHALHPEHAARLDELGALLTRAPRVEELGGRASLGSRVRNDDQQLLNNGAMATAFPEAVAR